jgi:hypothetical protein
LEGLAGVTDTRRFFFLFCDFLLLALKLDTLLDVEDL